MTNLGDLIRTKFYKNEFFFSIELYPPKSGEDLDKLYANLDDFLRKFRPLFVDITYHTNSQRPIEHPCSSFSIASKQFTFVTFLHFNFCDLLCEIKLYLLYLLI